MPEIGAVDEEFRHRIILCGILICTIRKAKGLTQEQLAEMAGISRSLLSKIETPGHAHSFTVEVLLQIARALEVRPEDIIGLNWNCIPEPEWCQPSDA